MNETLIIGAGPAGLAAAYELNKQKKKATIIEANTVPGGIARTEVYKTFRADLGGHRFFTKNDNIQKIWQEVCGDDFLYRNRLSRIYYNKKFFDYPLKAANVLINLGLVETALIMFSYAQIKLFPIHDPDNFEDWVISTFGRRLYMRFFKSYTEKVWGMSCRDISGDWAAQRIKNLSMREAVRNALLNNNNKKGEVITSLIEQFHYPRLGPGMMWQNMVKQLQAADHEVLFSHRAVSLDHADGCITAVHVKSDQGIKQFFPVQCISTMPLSVLIKSLNPAPPQEILHAADRLNYRDFIAVNLIIDQENMFPDNWIYIHDPDVYVGRIQNYKNWSPDMAPEEGKTVLGMEYFVFAGEAMWMMEDKNLISMAAKELYQIGLVDDVNKISDGWVTRVEKTYPVYDADYRETVTLLSGYLSTFNNLQTIGRNGQHRYNNMDHSMLTGIAAAQNINGANIDIWDINTEKEYHEKMKRPDIEAAVEMILHKISPIAFGAACAVVLSLIMSYFGAVSILSRDEKLLRAISLLGNYVPGFSATWSGLGRLVIQTLFSGFITGFTTALLRNFILSQYLKKLLKKEMQEFDSIKGQI